MKTTRILLAVVVASAMMLSAAEPIFYCDFDDTVAPVVAAGEKTPAVEVAPVFMPGVKGKALLVGLDEHGVRRGVEYPHEKNLDWTKGTISFWVKPVNWKGSDNGFFAMFFSTMAGQKMFYIYKYYTGEYLYLLRGENPEWLFSLYRPGEWKADEWHHLACVWDAVQQAIYIDGRLSAINRVYFPLMDLKAKKDFVIGENKNTMKLDGKGRMSLIDEFRIFDRILNREEISRLYQQDKPSDILPKEVVTVPYANNTFTGSGFTDMKTDEYAKRQNIYTLSFDDQALHVSLQEPSEVAKAVLTAPSGKKHVIELKDGKAEIALEPLGLKPGDEGWLLNLISDDTDLRGGLRLALDKDMPTMSFTPPYDLSRNVLDLKISKAPGFKLLFDRDWARQFGGFRRLNADLNQPYSYHQDAITDWARAMLAFEKDGKEYFRTELTIRRNEPCTVKFLYTKIRERELFVAFQGKTDGYAVVDYCDSTGEAVIQSEKVKIPEDVMAFYNLSFPLRLESGNYLIKVSHLDMEGKKTPLWDQELRVPPENDPLIAEYVDPDKDKLPPGGWTPVEAENDAVSIWGRTMKMDGGLLFSSLLSQGKELLAAPDALRLNGKRLEAVSVSVKKCRSTNLDSVFEKVVDYGELKAESRLSISFDGYAQITLNLIPRNSLKISELSYEIPMRNERLKLVRDNKASSKIAGLAGDSFTASLLKEPAIWVGDYYVGIDFTAENLINWHFSDQNRHVEMNRNEASANLRFLLVSAPLTLKEPREFKFGLTVTPIKPLERALLRKRYLKDWQLFDRWHHFAHLSPDNIRKDSPVNGMRDFYSQHNAFPVLFHYSAFNFTGPFSPYWTWYSENWQSIKFGRTYGVWTGNKPNAYCEGCLNDASFRNYKLNMTRDFINLKDNPLMIDGTRNFYYDAPYEWSCSNEKHGCRMWRDSTGRMRYHILVDAARSEALNLWRMIKRIGPESRVLYHAEWPKFLPHQGFLDATCGGEGQEQQVASNNGYFDILTPASFNATFSPYIYSVKTLLIPQLRRGLMITSPAKYRTWDLKNPLWRKAVLHYIGLAAVHDVDLMDRTELSYLWWKAQDELGWDEKTEFHPYYADEPALKVTPSSERIVASAYTNSGRLMLAVLNDTEQEQEISLLLDLNKLKVESDMKGHDAFAPELSWTLSNEWKGKIEPRGFRLVVFAK